MTIREMDVCTYEAALVVVGLEVPVITNWT